MKKINTKLILSMLLITVSVLASVGISLITNMTVEYYRNFEKTVSALFENGTFLELCRDFNGDIEPITEYLELSETTLCQSSQKEYYILKDGNIIKSSHVGGMLELSGNLRRVLDGGYSTDCDITSEKLDFAFALGDGYTVYVIDTRQELFSELRTVSVFFLQALLVGMALAAVLSFLISKRLTASIKKLEEGALSMSRGDFSEITVQSRDEIGRLCDVFNDMGRQIQRDFDEFEKAEQIQREFVANVSHELKTPITVIKSYSQTLLSVETDSETRNRFLATVDSEADRMSATVSELLQLSRLEQKTPSFEEGELYTLCSEVAAAFEIECKNRDISVVIDGDCKVLTDRELVKTIVYNLMSNAVKYSKKGGTVKITVSNDSAPCIRVYDNGIGISEKDAEHVFERFYRADKSRDRSTGGTGLGLSIAAESAKRIGAELSVKSKLGEFSEFTLTFSGDSK